MSQLVLTQSDPKASISRVSILNSSHFIFTARILQIDSQENLLT